MFTLLAVFCDYDPIFVSGNPVPCAPRYEESQMLLVSTACFPQVAQINVSLPALDPAFQTMISAHTQTLLHINQLSAEYYALPETFPFCATALSLSACSILCDVACQPSDMGTFQLRFEIRGAALAPSVLNLPAGFVCPAGHGINPPAGAQVPKPQ